MGRVSEVRWSYTRSKSLNGCLRAHWFTYFSRGEPEGNQAGQLKLLHTPPLLFGKVVEEVINSAMAQLRDGQPMPSDLTERAIQRWEQRLAQSKADVLKMKEGKTFSADAKPLTNDYYDHPLAREELLNYRGRLEGAIKGFESSELVQELLKVNRSYWDPIKTVDEYPVKWMLDGIPMSVALDFFIHKPKEWLWIIDWKSGLSTDPEDALQLAVYSLWGQHAKKLPAERVRVQQARIHESPKPEGRAVPENMLSMAKDTIRQTYEKELSLLEPTTWDNGRSALLARREVFGPKPSFQNCSLCKFKAICTSSAV